MTVKTNPVEYLLDQIEAQGLWERKKILRRNAFLKYAGSVDTNIYFIEKGSLRIFVEEDSEEHTIRFGYRNNFIAVLDSFLSESPSELSVQAIKRTELKVMGKKAFMRLVESSPDNMKCWLAIMGELVRQQMEREIDILTTSPEKRYRRVLRRSPALFQEIPGKYIASYLRMTPETLSRIKKS